MSELRDSILQHVHSECVDSPQRKVESLQHDIACLQSERSVEQAKLADERKVKHDFCLDWIKCDDKKIRHYTGFVTYGMLMACFNFLLPSAKEIRTWQGKRTFIGERNLDNQFPSLRFLYNNSSSW